jgi:hypothetical protein
MIPSWGFFQEPPTKAPEAEKLPPDPALLRLRDKLNPEFPVWSPAHTIERCAEHLAMINEHDRPRIRYFDMSDVPRQKLPAAVSALFFGANSAARGYMTYQPQAVPHTNNRVFWVDLCWYNWTPEAWESISQEDPYFREPIIPSESPGLRFLKEQTLANPVVRGGWFLWYVFDNGEFVNQKDAQLFNEKSFYYQLVYANVTFDRDVTEKTTEKKTVYEKQTRERNDGYRRWQEEVQVPVEKEVVTEKKVRKKVRGVGPKTAAEFESVWKVDFNVLREFPIDKGSAIDEGASNVSYQNRVVWRVRTAIGTYYRTFDVLRTAGDQDFIENPFPTTFDAGEHIVQDERGAQFYHLSDGKGNSLDFANPFVVKGDPSGPHNTVLVTSRSCIHCHSTGILALQNIHHDLREAGVQLRAITPDRAERFNQFFLQKKKMDKLVAADQENYSAFIKDCNGLTADENVQNFRSIRAWYGAPVTIAQAARELGAEVRELSDAIGLQGTKGRLGRLVLDGTPIPRSVWERGGFQEAGLLLLEWRKLAKIPNDHR